jgi:two-component system, OmpR family, response regulator
MVVARADDVALCPRPQPSGGGQHSSGFDERTTSRQWRPERRATRRRASASVKIIIVDNDMIVADLLADAVRKQGHQATAVYDAQEALALLRDQRPDAVLLDVSMPGMSGIEFLRTLRRTDPALPVILVTGEAKPEELEEARRLTVADIVEKPYIMRRISKALAAFAERDPQRRQEPTRDPRRPPPGA